MPHYKNAPITEAIIDFQVRLPVSVTQDKLREVADPESKQFPVAMEMRQNVIHVRGEEQPIHSQKIEGWLFRSSNEKRIVQARQDGFAFALLAPYDRWETFRDEARGIWEKYQTVATPESINRISLKFVNRFDLPLPIRDFKDFFRTVPEVSPDMPQGLAGFFMQMVIPYPELGSMLVLTETLVPPPQVGIVSVVLDIELACANNVPDNNDDIWELIDQLRAKKNEIFEACITDAARELIR